MSLYSISQCRAYPDVFSIGAIARVQDSLERDFPTLPFVQTTNMIRRHDIGVSSQPSILSVHGVFVSHLEQKARFSLYPSWPEDSLKNSKELPTDWTAVSVGCLKLYLEEFFGIQSNGYGKLEEIIRSGAEAHRQDRAQAKEKAAQAEAAIKAELKRLEDAAKRLVAVRAQHYPLLHSLPYGQSPLRDIRDEHSPWITFMDWDATKRIAEHAERPGLILGESLFYNDTRQEFQLPAQDGHSVELTICYSDFHNKDHHELDIFVARLPYLPGFRLDAPFAQSSNGYSTDYFGWLLPFSNIDFGKLMEPEPPAPCRFPYDNRLRSQISVHTAHYGTDIFVVTHYTHPQLHEALTHIVQVAFSVHLNRSRW